MYLYFFFLNTLSYRNECELHCSGVYNMRCRQMDNAHSKSAFVVLLQIVRKEINFILYIGMHINQFCPGLRGS